MDTIQQKLDRVETLWKDCNKCDLSAQRRNVVFWKGNHRARLAVIGEAPGEQEDKRGEPFIGEAGELFDSLCESAGLEPWDTFICNVVGCHPPRNRKPRVEEVKLCRARIYAMLATVKPAAMLLLGSTALETFTAQTSITILRGRIFTVKMSWKRRELVIPAVATLHPGFLLRHKDVKLKRAVVNDIRTAMELASPSFVEGD